jgi:hypothetical protein
MQKSVEVSSARSPQTHDDAAKANQCCAQRNSFILWRHGSCLLSSLLQTASQKISRLGYRSEGYHQLNREILYRKVASSRCPKQTLPTVSRTFLHPSTPTAASTTSVSTNIRLIIHSFPRSSVESLQVFTCPQDTGLKNQIQSRE